MAYFHVSCFVHEARLHKLMLALEGFAVRDLKVATLAHSEVAEKVAAEAKPAKPPKPPRYYKVSNDAVVLTMLRDAGPQRVRDLARALVKEGRSEHSINSLLAKLQHNGSVKRNSQGTYSLAAPLKEAL